jgi:hypothetical protein
MEWAAGGFREHNGVGNVLSDVPARLLVEAKRQNSTIASMKGMQKFAATAIAPVVLRDGSKELVQRRLRTLLADDALVLRDDAWEAACGCAMALSPYSACCVWKTWTNAWTTSHRMHENPASCVFGCDEDDTMSHYLDCRFLRSLAADITFAALDPSRSNLLGLVSPSLESAAVLAMLFRIYHVVKCGHYAEVARAAACGRYARVKGIAHGAAKLARHDMLPELQRARVRAARCGEPAGLKDIGCSPCPPARIAVAACPICNQLVLRAQIRQCSTCPATGCRGCVRRIRNGGTGAASYFCTACIGFWDANRGEDRGAALSEPRLELTRHLHLCVAGRNARIL